MRSIENLLGGVALIESRRFADARGSFTVLWEERASEAVGLPTRFVQDNCSLSTGIGTVRGLHLQLPPHQQGKLVRVVAGCIVDVFVDLRPGSPTHGHHGMIELSAGDGRQLWIPPGFAHGFCTLEPDTEVFYKVDAAYMPAAERTLAWNDPALGIEWPVDPASVVLSDKDAAGWSLPEIVGAITAATEMSAAAAAAEEEVPV